jgi:hypothetical protein
MTGSRQELSLQKRISNDESADRRPTPTVTRTALIVTFAVEPEDARRAVVLSRWRNVCPSCFDGEAERASIRYRFVNVRAMPWSEMPEPQRRYGRKRR